MFVVFMRGVHRSYFFFFNDTATTEIYTLSLHDALPICGLTSNSSDGVGPFALRIMYQSPNPATAMAMIDKQTVINPTNKDRKSTRLNSSHSQISYAVFCLKKKKPLEATPTQHRQVKHHR